MVDKLTLIVAIVLTYSLVVVLVYSWKVVTNKNKGGFWYYFFYPVIFILELISYIG